jgi:hypothetical protein
LCATTGGDSKEFLLPRVPENFTIGVAGVDDSGCCFQ